MTDEQVQRIVDALSGSPWEPWVTIAVALVSVLLGFGLSQVSERAGRRRHAHEKAVDERRAAASGALKVTLELQASSPGDIAHRTTILAASITAPAVALWSAGGQRVAGWWQAQMLGLLGSANGRSWSAEEIASRTRTAAEVAVRLDAWANGELSDTAFEFVPGESLFRTPQL